MREKVNEIPISIPEELGARGGGWPWEKSAACIGSVSCAGREPSWAVL